MPDYIHLTNIIQGEVIKIRERRPLETQPELLSELRTYLEGQITSITITRMKVIQEQTEA